MAKAKEEMAAYKNAWYLAHRDTLLARNKSYRVEHDKEIKAKRKIYRETHKEKIVEERKKHYDANREKVLSRNRRYVETHREEDKETHRTWYKNHREEWLARVKNYRETHREECATRQREYHRTHPEEKCIATAKRRALKRNAGGSFSLNEWRMIKSMYGNQCLSCGKSDVKLTADHIVPLSKGGRNDISNIQPLCHICNCKKRTETIDYRPAYYWAEWT